MVASLDVFVILFRYPKACVVDEHSLCLHFIRRQTPPINPELASPVFSKCLVAVEVLLTALALVPVPGQYHFSAPSFVEP